MTLAALQVVGPHIEIHNEIDPRKSACELDQRRDGRSFAIAVAIEVSIWINDDRANRKLRILSRSYALREDLDRALIVARY